MENGERMTRRTMLTLSLILVTISITRRERKSGRRPFPVIGSFQKVQIRSPLLLQVLFSLANILISPNRLFSFFSNIRYLSHTSSMGIVNPLSVIQIRTYVTFFPRLLPPPLHRGVRKAPGDPPDNKISRGSPENTRALPLWASSRKGNRSPDRTPDTSGRPALSPSRGLVFLFLFLFYFCMCACLVRFFSLFFSQCVSLFSCVCLYLLFSMCHSIIHYTPIVGVFLICISTCPPFFCSLDRYISLCFSLFLSLPPSQPFPLPCSSPLPPCALCASLSARVLSPNPTRTAAPAAARLPPPLVVLCRPPRTASLASLRSPSSSSRKRGKGQARAEGRESRAKVRGNRESRRVAGLW